MPLLERLYSGAVSALRPALPLLAHGEGKLARGIRGRARVLGRMRAWAATERDPARPLAWFHAPSVGEGLQARAVMQALRGRRPEVQLAYTYFSPSAEKFAAGLEADFADYLPLDEPAGIRAAFDALRPGVIVFNKSEVWPVLTREAERSGIPLLLLSATLPAGSSRLRGPARALLGAAYRRLDAVAAISPADAERFGALGVAEGRRRVMGDARFDQVWARAQAADRASPLLAPFAGSGVPVLVAGSTWPADEEVLLPAVASLVREGRSLHLMLTPHEPTPEHLARAEAQLAGLGLSCRRLGELGDGPLAQVTLVDRVGVLGDLYAVAQTAWVGGGFGSAGLHSVLEPAAFGVPVLFGPRHANAREAGELTAAGGAFVVTTPAEAQRTLAGLLDVYEVRQRAAGAARAYVNAHLGAALRGAELVEAALDGTLA